ncbi:MAG: DUF4960 domain-containing protein [Prevotella sp.]|nr:DUF4960 domain-containing protein [Prevotella sp.]
MKKILSGFISLLTVCLGLASCSDVEIPEAVTSETVSALTSSVSGRNVTLNWTNPVNASGVQILKNNTLVANFDSIVTSYLDRHVAVNTDLWYTVKAKYSDGRVSEGQSLKQNIQYEANAKPAMLITAESIDAIEDDDEKAAAQWFHATYPDGAILTPGTLSTLYPDEYNVVWIQIDRVGIDMGWQKLPANMVSDKVIGILTQYVKDGGNLLLTKHATQLTVVLGRIDEKFGPHIFSSGQGGQGTDNWTVNGNIGCDQDKPYDHRKHDIYAGMTTNMDFGHESFGLEGPGFREDHNCMWDLNSYGLPDLVPTAHDVVDAYQQYTNCTMLGTWGHVSDYCCAGIIDFNPTPDMPGRIFAIGLSAYEWDENGTTNTYQSNMERLTKNSIGYLSK